MSCKCCNKAIYFDSDYYHCDGGYGDNDWGGTDIHRVFAKVCPVCGTVKVPEKYQGEDAKEYVLKVLSSVMAHNFNQIDEKIISKPKVLEEMVGIALKKASTTYSEGVLKKNGLTYHSLTGDLKCECNNVLCKAPTSMEALAHLDESRKNFCDVCGKKLKPIDWEIEDDSTLFETVVGTKNEWNRGDR